jgi:hypothetical protein
MWSDQSGQEQQAREGVEAAETEWDEGMKRLLESLERENAKMGEGEAWEGVNGMGLEAQGPLEGWVWGPEGQWVG